MNYCGRCGAVAVYIGISGAAPLVCSRDCDRIPAEVENEKTTPLCPKCGESRVAKFMGGTMHCWPCGHVWRPS